MKHFAVLPLAVVLTLAPLAAQTSYNAALQRPVTVIYANPDPAFISYNYSNPAKLVDGITSFSSIFEIYPGNAGTRIIVDLADTPTITRATLRSPTKDFRIRGFEVKTSTDSITWTPWFANASNDTNVIDLSDQSRAFRWFELHISKTDSFMSTVLSEITLTAVIDRPYVTSVTLGPPLQSSPPLRPILWSTLFWDSSQTVRIEVGPVPGQLVLVDSAALNDGSFNWNTAILPDSLYTVRVTPNGDRALGASTGVQIRNFNQLSAQLELGPSTIGATYLPPTYVHGLKDSLRFRWTFSTPHSLPYGQHLEYSPDSGRSWLMLTSIGDVGERSAVVATNELPTSGYHAFARHVVTLNGQRMVSTRFDHAFQIASLPPGSRLEWAHRVEHSYPNFEVVPSISGGPLGVRSTNGAVTIISNHGTAFSGTGIPQGGLLLDDPPNFPIAATDLDDDGKIEFVAAAYDTSLGLGAGVFRHYPDSSIRLAFLPAGAAVNSASIADVDGDGALDIFLGTLEGAMLFSRDGTLKRTYGGSGTIRSVLVDLTSSPGFEVVQARVGGFMVWTAAGDSVPGFPYITTATTAAMVPFDADADGKDEFLVCADNRVVCLDDAHPWIASFSVSLGEQFVSTPVVADLNGDGKVEAIIAARQRTYVPALGDYADSLVMTCLDGEGNPLPGWPRIEPFWKTFTVYRNEGPFGIVPRLTPFSSGPAHVLVASIDGDLLPEIIFSSADGYLNVFNADGSTHDGYPVLIGTRTLEAPIAGDFDGDGALNLVYRVLQEHPARTTFVNVEFPPGSYNPNATPWPMYMANAQRTGKGNPTMPVGVRDDEAPRIPTVFMLAPNYPNPFNPSTTIEYSIPREVHVNVRVFNLLGQCVTTLVDGVRSAGTHRTLFTAENVPSGMYIVSVAAGSDRASHKILLMK